MRTKVKKETEIKTKPEKWEVKYEDDYSICVWKYNSKISMVNPYETTIEYKGEKEEKKKTRTRKIKS